MPSCSRREWLGGSYTAQDVFGPAKNGEAHAKMVEKRIENGEQLRFGATSGFAIAERFTGTADSVSAPLCGLRPHHHAHITRGAGEVGTFFLML